MRNRDTDPVVAPSRFSRVDKEVQMTPREELPYPAPAVSGSSIVPVRLSEL